MKDKVHKVLKGLTLLRNAVIICYYFEFPLCSLIPFQSEKKLYFK